MGVRGPSGLFPNSVGEMLSEECRMSDSSDYMASDVSFYTE